MKIISISETPNHNTMKITLSESREGMTSDTYTKVDDSQPAFIAQFLSYKHHMHSYLIPPIKLFCLPFVSILNQVLHLRFQYEIWPFQFVI